MFSPNPPRNIFVEKTTGEVVDRMMKEGQMIFWMDHISYLVDGEMKSFTLKDFDWIPTEKDIFGRPVDKTPRKGIYRYLFGGVPEDRDGKIYVARPVPLLYPEKCLPNPRALQGINIAKRILATQLKFFTTKQFVFSAFPALFLPFSQKIKLIETWLRGFVDLCDVFLGDQYLTPELYCDASRGIQTFLETFLVGIGISQEIAWTFARIFATIIEFDSAYRYRLEDIMSTTTIERLLAHPRRELNQLIEIFAQREPRTHLVDKIKRFVKPLTYLLILPKFKKAFIQALKATDIKLFQLDDADRYHVLKFASYKFLGEEYEPRDARYNQLHHGEPPIAQFIQS